MIGSVPQRDVSYRPRTMRQKLRGVSLLLLRLYLPCLIASPFALLTTQWMVHGIPYKFADPDDLLGLSGVLFFGALLLGVPLAVWVSHLVPGFGARTAALVVAGAISIVLVLMPFAGMMSIIAAPAGAITAFSCCAFNFNKLREPSPRLI